MPDKIWAALSPERVQVDAGGQPATIVVGAQNMSAEVDNLSVEVEGLDATWYSLSGSVLQLFPNERGQAQLVFQVPLRSDIRSGSYPFTVRVRSRRDPTELTATQGVLEIKPQHVYRFDVMPKKVYGRQGRFRAIIQNSGTADLELELQGKDTEGRCRFSFQRERPVTVPGVENTISFKVKPRRSNWVGDPKTFNLTITAASDSGAETKMVTAQFIHQPRLRSWGPIVKPLIYGIIALVLGTAFIWPVWLRIDAVENAKAKLWSMLPFGQHSSVPGSQLVFTEGFKQMHDAVPDLVGDPTENVTYDYKGNGYQNTTKGTLFWLKSTNTTYFMSQGGVYVFRAGRSQQIDPR